MAQWLQKTVVLFLLHTWQLTTTWNYSSRGSDSTGTPPHTHVQTPTQTHTDLHKFVIKLPCLFVLKLTPL